MKRGKSAAGLAATLPVMRADPAAQEVARCEEPAYLCVNAGCLLGLQSLRALWPVAAPGQPRACAALTRLTYLLPSRNAGATGPDPATLRLDRARRASGASARPDCRYRCRVWFEHGHTVREPRSPANPAPAYLVFDPDESGAQCQNPPDTRSHAAACK